VQQEPYSRPKGLALWCLEEKTSHPSLAYQQPSLSKAVAGISFPQQWAIVLVHSLKPASRLRSWEFCSQVLGFSQQDIHIQALVPRRSKPSPAYWRTREVHSGVGLR